MAQSSGIPSNGSALASQSLHRSTSVGAFPLYPADIDSTHLRKLLVANADSPRVRKGSSVHKTGGKEGGSGSARSSRVSSSSRLVELANATPAESKQEQLWKMHLDPAGGKHLDDLEKLSDVLALSSARSRLSQGSSTVSRSPAVTTRSVGGEYAPQASTPVPGWSRPARVTLDLLRRQPGGGSPVNSSPRAPISSLKTSPTKVGVAPEPNLRQRTVSFNLKHGTAAAAPAKPHSARQVSLNVDVPAPARKGKLTLQDARLIATGQTASSEGLPSPKTRRQQAVERKAYLAQSCCKLWWIEAKEWWRARQEQQRLVWLLTSGSDFEDSPIGHMTRICGCKHNPAHDNIAQPVHLPVVSVSSLSDAL